MRHYRKEKRGETKENRFMLSHDNAVHRLRIVAQSGSAEKGRPVALMPMTEGLSAPSLKAQSRMGGLEGV
jgi:hypothetical protein